MKALSLINRIISLNLEREVASAAVESGHVRSATGNRNRLINMAGRNRQTHTVDSKLMYFWTEFGYTLCNQWIPMYNNIRHHIHIFCCASQEDRALTHHHLTHHRSQLDHGSHIPHSGFIIARQPPGIINWKSMTKELRTETTPCYRLSLWTTVFTDREAFAY